MNPNFGILRNGSIVVGYLTEEHIVNLDWVNLVQGIIWLVRQGKVCPVFVSGKVGYILFLCPARNCTSGVFVRKVCPEDVSDKTMSSVRQGMFGICA